MALIPRISIIIPVSTANHYLEECLEHCHSLDYPDFEIILLPDEPLNRDLPGIRVIPTGHTGPSLKRNIGISHATGKICAFIDADAYPTRDWLRKAAAAFSSPEVAAVGGPNLTPKNDGPMKQANSIIFSSFLGGSRYKVRYAKSAELNSWELQTVNMFVRKPVLDKLGGFQVGLWPGEDAKLSFQIADVLKMKQLYIPELIVYHHRRPLFKPYLDQVWRSGITKGLLLKKFFSLRRLEYFLPSLFVLGLIFGAFLISLHPILNMLYLSVVGIYLLGALITGMKTGNLKMGAVVFAGLILTHLTYGIAFLIGLLRRQQV
jgi:cellulose synthase/poly-beta-1,6-N-acetylglucosamine synthase-like glycosyltransferase